MVVYIFFSIPAFLNPKPVIAVSMFFSIPSLPANRRPILRFWGQTLELEMLACGAWDWDVLPVSLKLRLRVLG